MAGGLVYRALDLQDAGIWLDLVAGYAERPAVRGEDVVIPSRPGRVWMPKVPDRRIIELRGYVYGRGPTAADRREDWRERTDALMAVMDPELTAGTLTVAAPYLGLAAGARTIEAVVLSALGGDVESTMQFQRWSVQLEAFGESLEWADVS